MHTAQAYGQDVHREEGGRAGDVHSLGRHHHQVPGGHHHRCKTTTTTTTTTTRV